LVLLKLGNADGRDMLTGATVKGVRTATESASIVDDDAVFFCLAITHDCPNFSVGLLHEGNSKGMVTKPLDSPVRAVWGDLP